MIAREKIELRKYAFSLREQIPEKRDKSIEICRNIQSLKEYSEAQVILAFYPFGDEPDIRILFEDKTKTFFLPRVENDFLAFYEYSENTALHKNKWGIFEPAPVNKLADEAEAGLIIVPALAVDRKGYRLGYGGGYYDKFLPTLTNNSPKICPAFSELLLINVPHDELDIRIDKVVTENQIVNC